MQKLFLVLTCVLTFMGEQARTSNAKADPVVKINLHSSTLGRDQVQKAVDIFKENCSPLNKHWADITSIDVTVQEDFAEHRLARGWKTQIKIEIKVPAKPRSIPAYVDQNVGVL